MSAVPWRSVSSPAASSPWTSVADGGRARARPEHHRRKIVLYVHLSQDALTARLEQGNHLITPGQLRDRCGGAGKVVVKPVLDPTAHDPVDTPVVPDRHRELVAVRDQTCVFPWCTRPARSCDADHIIPSRGADQRVRATRPHCADDITGSRRHRLDLHPHRSRHVPLVQPHGYQYLRDPDGTRRPPPTTTTRTPAHPAGHPAPDPPPTRTGRRPGTTPTMPACVRAEGRKSAARRRRPQPPQTRAGDTASPAPGHRAPPQARPALITALPRSRGLDKLGRLHTSPTGSGLHRAHGDTRVRW